MKNTILGLMAVTLVASPAFAASELSVSELKQIAATQVVTPVAGSWRTQLFSRLDTDANSLVTVLELEQTGCRVNNKFYAFANADRDAGLSKGEFFNNRDLFSRCK